MGRLAIIGRVAGDAIQVVLEIEAQEESASGRASVAGRTMREFSGWLGLLTVLEALHAEPSRQRESPGEE